MGRLLLVGAILMAAACGGSDDGEAFTPPPQTYDGAVAVHLAPQMPGSTNTQFRADAYFLDYTGKTHVPNGFDTIGHRATDCHKREASTCTLVTCTVVMDASVTFDDPTFSSAGTITVTRSSGPSITMSPTTEGYYNGMLDNAAMAAVGETVMIEASGGAVPAFSETLPLKNVLMQVTPAGGAQVTVHATSDLQINWTGGSSGKVTVALQNNPDMGDMASLECSFDATAGHGAIPKELIAALPEWSPGWTASLFDDSTVKKVGNWPVSLNALYQSAFSTTGFTFAIEP